MITLGFICAESKICSTIKKSQNIINMVADSSLISLSFFGSLDFFSFVLQFCRILTVSKLYHFVFNIFKFWIIFVSSFFSYNLCLQMVYQWARITLHSLPNDSEKKCFPSLPRVAEESSLFSKFHDFIPPELMKSVTPLCSVGICPPKTYFCIFFFDNDYFKRVYQPIFFTGGLNGLNLPLSSHRDYELMS